VNSSSATGPASASPEPGAIPERVHDLVDGRLGPQEAERERARIAADPALREAHDDLLRVRDFVRSRVPSGEALTPPPGFSERLRARLDAERVAIAPRLGRRLPRVLALAYAAAALVVVGATVAYVARDEPTEHALSASAESEEATLAAVREQVADAQPSATAVPPPAGAPAATFGAPGGSVRPGLRRTKEETAEPLTFVLTVGKGAGAADEWSALLRRLGAGATLVSEVAARSEADGRDTKARGSLAKAADVRLRAGAATDGGTLLSSHVLRLDAAAWKRLLDLAGPAEAPAPAQPAAERLVRILVVTPDAAESR